MNLCRISAVFGCLLECFENLPVCGCLPSSIIETVEHVEKHGTNITTISPVHRNVTSIFVDALTCVPFLESISTAPDYHGENEQSSKSSLRSDGSAELLQIEAVTKDNSTNDLRAPVQQTVQCLSTGIENGTVDTIELVGGKPVGRPEHWEEKDNVVVRLKGIIETDKFGDPGWILLQHNLGAIFTVNIRGVAEAKGKDSAQSHEDNESNVGSIIDIGVGSNTDVLPERNLYNKC
jgi:hypothetical protein